MITGGSGGGGRGVGAKKWTSHGNGYLRSQDDDDGYDDAIQLNPRSAKEGEIVLTTELRQHSGKSGV